MKYLAQNTEEIAAEMTRRGDVARKWADGAKRESDKRDAQIEAQTWDAAAELLRSTELAK